MIIDFAWSGNQSDHMQWSGNKTDCRLQSGNQTMSCATTVDCFPAVRAQAAARQV